MALFQNKKQMVIYIVIFLVLFFGSFLVSKRAMGAESILQLSGGNTLARGPTEVLDLTVVFPQAGPKGSDFEFGVTMIGTSDYFGKPQPNNFLWHGELVNGYGNFDVGFGAAYLQKPDIYLGCNLQFTLQLQYRWSSRWVTKIQHFSSAGTCSPNTGRDMALIGYRF